MQGEKIAVAGGGIGGLTAALALLRHGFAVDVFEAAPAFADIGAGVTLAPNAMMGYVHLGIAHRIIAAGMEPQRQEVRHWQDGRVLLALERGNRMQELYGAPYAYLHRADLHAILLAAVEDAGGVVRRGSAVVGARADDAAGYVELANGEVHTADLVVGADGLKSVVRQMYEPAPPHFTGHIAWRSVVPADGPLRALADSPGTFIGPGRLAVYYPLRGGSLLNMVFFARESGWEQEGWTIPAARSDLETVFAGWCEPVQQMIAHTVEGQLFKWAINARTALKTWSIGDRITLLGDAAHAMTPFLGQGASTAIEDAVILARVLATSPDRADALRRYEAARIDRTSMIQAESNANADRMQGEDSDLFGMKNLRNEETLGLFAYDCGTVAV